ncbi:MAG: hypothetical protein MUF49_19720 [Oculatellaceae cyanobacterium Prado106]|jgi:hypothetical protein|nr:hypothetical protein [Oculatellaceae cyanobacterium Prado106]
MPDLSLETSLLGILSILAIALLVVVTGGVAYLTTMEWRDRRRLDREKRGR